MPTPAEDWDFGVQVGRVFWSRRDSIPIDLAMLPVLERADRGDPSPYIQGVAAGWRDNGSPASGRASAVLMAEGTRLHRRVRIETNG